MNNESADDLDKRVAPHLEYFADRSNLLFAYHFSVAEFKGDKDFSKDVSESNRAWALKTIQNACLHSSLMAVRDLDDFFTPRTSKTQMDDLRASDFGMLKSLRFLIDNERISINKLIAHTTQHGSSNLGYKWDIHELIFKAAAQCDAFLEWIKDSCNSSDHFETWTSALAIQAKTKSILKWAQKEASLESE